MLEVREAMLPDDTSAALSPAVKAMWIAAAGRKKDVVQDDEETVNADADDDDIFAWKDDTGGDFTNCSGSCGYCGRCGSS